MERVAQVLRMGMLGIMLAGAISLPFLADAQTVVPDQRLTMKAQVTSVSDQHQAQVPGTDVASQYQTITATVLEGAEKGKSVTIENDYLALSVGEVFYLQHTTNSVDGTDYYTVSDPYRLPWVIGIVALFIGAVLLIGGWQGARGLVSLAGSLVLIFFVLLPGILSGYSPILLSVGVASVIIVFGSYVTHGFTRSTTAAVIGMILTVLLTGTFAYVAIHGAQLSGFSTEESVYLNMNTRGSIDFVGLLFGGIMIGLLGVLYDAAIGQAVATEELIRVAPHLSRRFIFSRALRIGREHIGALVNTLAIAYVGATLPLLLLMYSGGSVGIAFTLNRELFSTEIVRAAIGSLGLVLAVPITTLVAVFMLHRAEGGASAAEVIAEQAAASDEAAHHH